MIEPKESLSEWESRLRMLYSVRGGVIAGDEEGHLHWIETKALLTVTGRFCWTGNDTVNVVTAQPGGKSLLVPLPPAPRPIYWPDPLHLSAEQFMADVYHRELIELKEHEVAGWHIRAGYGPQSRIWYISSEEPYHDRL